MPSLPRERCAVGPPLAVTLTLGLTLALTLALTLGTAAPAMAQTRAAHPAIPDHPSTMSVAQLQGVSCIVAGVAGAVGAAVYSGPIATAATDWSLPFLLAPAMVGAYAIGCTIGATTGPGLHWLYVRYVGDW